MPHRDLEYSRLSWSCFSSPVNEGQGVITVSLSPISGHSSASTPCP